MRPSVEIEELDGGNHGQDRNNKDRHCRCVWRVEERKCHFPDIIEDQLGGIGRTAPSSSHTVGPMRASRLFVNDLDEQQLLANVTDVKVEQIGRAHV